MGPRREKGDRKGRIKEGKRESKGGGGEEGGRIDVGMRVCV